LTIFFFFKIYNMQNTNDGSLSLDHLLMKVSYLLQIPHFSGETFLSSADNAPCSMSHDELLSDTIISTLVHQILYKHIWTCMVNSNTRIIVRVLVLCWTSSTQAFFIKVNIVGVLHETTPQKCGLSLKQQLNKLHPEIEK
jgi:hypothetical protein